MEAFVAPVFHKKVPVPVAVKLTVGLAQLIAALLGEIATVGAAKSPVTVAAAEAVQPLATLVTVTTKTPAWKTVGVAVVPPVIVPGPLHWYVQFTPTGPPCKATEFCAQLNVPVAVAVATGGERSSKTVMVALAEQPFAPVTVTSYTPPALTKIAAVVSPVAQA